MPKCNDIWTLNSINRISFITASLGVSSTRTWWFCQREHNVWYILLFILFFLHLLSLSLLLLLFSVCFVLHLLLLLSRPRSSSWYINVCTFIYWVLYAFQSHQNESNWQTAGWQKNKWNEKKRKAKRKRMRTFLSMFFMWFRCVWTLTILLHRKHYSIYTMISAWFVLGWFGWLYSPTCWLLCAFMLPIG